jgi:hypothetical protein
MSDMEYLIRQLKSETSRYLWLAEEAKRTRVEVEKTAQRLELLKRLLALEGESVEVSREVIVQAGRFKCRSDF